MKASKTILVSAIAGFVTAFISVQFMAKNEKNVDTKAQQQVNTVTTELNCSYGTWPPYLIKDPNSGELYGISVEVIEQISKALNIKFNWTEEVGYGDYLEGFASNRYDLFCTSVWPEPERLKRSVVTVPMYYSVMNAYVRADDFRFDGDLSKINQPDIKTISIEGDMVQEIAEQDFPNSGNHALPQMSTHGDMFSSLTSGKGDVLFLDDGIIKDFEANNPGLIRRVEGVAPIRAFPEHLSLNPTIAHLKPAFDAAIQTMIADGRMAKILSEYDVSTYAQTFELNDGSR